MRKSRLTEDRIIAVLKQAERGARRVISAASVGSASGSCQPNAVAAASRSIVSGRLAPFSSSEWSEETWQVRMTLAADRAG